MIDFHSLEKGDRICIRGFEDMASEFGLTRDGFIRPGGGLPSCFNPDMKEYCGKIGTILKKPGGHRLEIMFDDDLFNRKAIWNFYDWMVDMIDNKIEYAKLPDIAQLYSI